MGCCRNMNAEKKKAIVTILRPELLNDIAGLAYVEGDMIKSDDEHDRHQVQDIVEDGNIERVTRILDLTMDEIVELCYPYTKQAMQEEARVNDIYHEQEAYRIYMSVPSTMSQTTINYVEKLVHELMVDRVMEDWTSITKPAATQNWNNKAEDTRKRIKSALVSRIGTTRRRLSPF